MKSLFSNTMTIVVLVACATYGPYSLADKGAKKGKPFRDLQAQIDELTAKLEQLESGAVVPLSLDVDCAAGESVNAALASVQDNPAPVTVTISGVCSESVGITRSDVTLRGNTPNDGVEGLFAVFAIADATRVKVESLTLSGSFAALTCSGGAALTGTNLTITNSARGVLVFHNGDCRVVDSVIQNGQRGLVIGANSYVRLQGSTIEGMDAWAALVESGGGLYLEGTTNNPVSIVKNNQRGVNVFLGGAVQLVSAVIENNVEFGLQAHSTSTISFPSNPNVQIRNNEGHGVNLQTSSSMSFLGTGISINDNGGFGINCFGTTNIFEFNAGTTSTMVGNALGDVAAACQITQTSN